MKDLISKVHDCYKIHTLLRTGNFYPSSIDNPLYGYLPFLQENLEPLSSMVFQKSQSPSAYK